MVFLLQKGVCDEIGITVARLSSYCYQANSDAAEGFDYIIDFLSGSYIHYALTVNPHIYISCIKQFWNIASVKRSGDVTRLQALVDKKKIAISKAVIHEILQLNDAEGLTQVGDLSTHNTRFISPALTQKVFANMRRVGKGFSDVEIPLFEVEENVAKDVAHDAIPSPSPHDIPSPSQEPSLPSQQQQRIELVKDAEVAESEERHAAQQVEKQAEIYNLDLDHSSKVLSIQEDDSEVQEVVEVMNTAKLITEVVTTAASQVSAASITIPAAKPTIPVAAPTVVVAYIRRRKGVIIRDPEVELPLKTPAETPKVKDKGKGILVETPKPMKKKDQIELDAEYAKKLHEEIYKDYEEFSKDIDWDAAMDHVNQKSNNPQYIKRYQGMKKRPQTESKARKNMMIYLKNTVGYKMDFFKGMTYAQNFPIFQARFDENIRKLSKKAQEAEDLRKRLEVVEDEDDDVFVEATPLASKVPVVEYQIVLIDNKPRFKIIRVDETHQFYISFATLLKNFDREDLENLWRIVKDRFSTSKPTNFSDEYLLLTLKKMFEEPDGQDTL
uniref:Xylulose kinase-1 n=1 Tax=Tanacetum cinerariifolium TaxID=118510 RepID=A0A699INB0_TANCI|nr:hypothetical protein [Tanacetum cinerariifolium]